MPYWTENVPTPASVPVGGLPTSVAVDKNVGFQSHSVIVDNYTTWWLWLPDPDVYIPPYWVGVIRNLQHQTDFVYAQWKSPFASVQQPAGISSYFVHFTWTTEVLTPAGGSLLEGFSFSSSGIVFPGSFVNLPDTTVLAVPIVAPAIALPAVPLLNRRALMFQAAETNTDYIYIGGPNVTVSRTPGLLGGVSLAPQQTYPIDTNGAISYAIAKTSGQIIIIQEGA
jgi:hypothetical protein